MKVKMKITKFENIEAWKEARILVRLIYKLSKKEKFSKDWRLIGQIQGAAVSIMGNIAEGFDRRSNKELSNFLNIALGSTSEVQSHLYVALDQRYITQKEFQEAYEQAVKVKKLIYGFMRYLKNSSRIK